MSEIYENNQEIPVTEEEVGFQVDDDQKADWCLRKIREEKAETDRWTDFYTEQIAKVTKRSEYRIAFFEEKLKSYFAQVPHKKTKTQENYALPSGKLVYKRQAPEFVRDDAQLMPWVKQNRPDLVKTLETVDWAQLKKVLDLMDLTAGDGFQRMVAVTEDGEVVPGITVHERPDVFKAEVK